MVTIAIGVIIIALYFWGVLYFKLVWVNNAAYALLTPSATLFVGFYAYILYKKQKDDTKKDAANIIFLEILNAEKVLKIAQRSLEKIPPELPYDVITMATESWSKNKYFFVNDFSSNEWEAINNFYNTCHLFDEAVRTSSAYFPKNEEQVRVNIQRYTANLTKKYLRKIKRTNNLDQKQKLQAELQAKAKEYMDMYLHVSTFTHYNPQKSVLDAKLCVELLKLNISLPSALNKLNDLSK